MPEFFENIKEQDIIDRIKQFTFSEEEFDRIKAQIKDVLDKLS